MLFSASRATSQAASRTPSSASKSSRADAPGHPLLAWRERVGHVIDVLPSKADLETPTFSASIDRFGVGDLTFTDCRSGAMQLDRSIARISNDTHRRMAFHVFLEGGTDDVIVHRTSRRASPGAATLLALDLGQPVRMRRQACRVLTVFAPASVAAEVFPDPGFMHGRGMRADTPLARLIVDHLASLSRNIRQMDAHAIDVSIRSGVQLLTEAFCLQAGLRGNARAAKRAAMFERVRRYIQANLFDDDLSPERVLGVLDLPRPTLYRMFEHEGGMATYIRHLRLRHAADDLVRRADLSVTEIAYGAGFSSPSDFTRAFRRAFDMTPQDFRAMSRIDAPLVTTATGAA
ncbi:AraC family transcriptional regulator [Pararobbsia silviterrae]|uniref:AraC family transcriptional regulator n=2 Tax=Pararobbsia silviterrae TaxID=1792498 RepID=A0A494Y212_9BURK|nr:AraC family transcriptional regulator [Pararobbsia silviterrae]